MSILVEESSVAPAAQPPAVSSPSPSPTGSHPSPCPSWCKDGDRPLEHTFGPSTTWHWSPQYRLANPVSEGPDTLLFAEIVRNDEDSATGEPAMFVQAQGAIEVGADDADILIAQMQAFVDTLRVLRRQMG